MNKESSSDESYLLLLILLQLFKLSVIKESSSDKSYLLLLIVLLAIFVLALGVCHSIKISALVLYEQPVEICCYIISSCSLFNIATSALLVNQRCTYRVWHIGKLKVRENADYIFDLSKKVAS